MNSQKNVSVLQAFSTKACMACLMSVGIMGIVVLFHDYPGHGHWEFMHNIIQNDASDNDPDTIRLLTKGEVKGMVFERSLFLWGPIVVVFFYRREALIFSNDGIPSTGMRSPPAGNIISCELHYIQSQFLHSDHFRGSPAQSIMPGHQTTINDSSCRHFMTAGSSNHRNYLNFTMKGVDEPRSISGNKQ